MSSPRPWGCFLLSGKQFMVIQVFPTPVGVFLTGSQNVGIDTPLVTRRSSPRPWGCFSRMRAALAIRFVFPTPVGVFPTLSSADYTTLRLPHARGGVSVFALRMGGKTASSPRPWGCFYHRHLGQDIYLVFPTPVGVFPRSNIKRDFIASLPHARGGVSVAMAGCASRKSSSPRPWGCFYFLRNFPSVSFVFPTPVGVFPELLAFGVKCFGLSHARGVFPP